MVHLVALPLFSMPILGYLGLGSIKGICQISYVWCINVHGLLELQMGNYNITVRRAETNVTNFEMIKLSDSFKGRGAIQLLILGVFDV